MKPDFSNFGNNIEIAESLSLEEAIEKSWRNLSKEELKYAVILREMFPNQIVGGKNSENLPEILPIPKQK